MTKHDTNQAQLKMTIAMGIFGTIGLFRRWILLPSSMIACMRGGIGAAFLLVLVTVSKRRIDRSAIQKNLWRLLASGAMIGFNWILLFEAYRYTSVATATLCYYLAPVFVILASPFVLKEHLTAKKSICAIVALIGMVLVSGIIEDGFPSFQEGRGILYGLGAALLYAAVIVMNKKLHDINVYDQTIWQLGTAAVVLLPYTILTEDIHLAGIAIGAYVLLLVMGVVHTGVAYALYFGSLQKLSGQNIALLSYLDPCLALLLSAFVLHEPMSVYGWIGAILILGAAAVSST